MPPSHVPYAIRLQLPKLEPTAHYETVSRAIQYIREQAGSQPSLADIAAHVGMSPSHLIEVFHTWAGITPKQLLKVFTLDRAKPLLRENLSTLDASLACGLSGSGRLHDLFVTIDAVSPGEFKRKGKGLTFEWGIQDTPFGSCFIACSQRGLSHLHFLPPNHAAEMLEELRRDWNCATVVENRDATAAIVQQIFHGAQSGQPLPLVLKGTAFQVKVWRALLEIPPGQTVAYSALAHAIGEPAAHRACASAVGRNPIAYLIPCHRVLRKNLALGGYRWGLERKAAMLASEQTVAQTGGSRIDRVAHDAFQRTSR